MGSPLSHLIAIYKYFKLFIFEIVSLFRYRPGYWILSVLLYLCAGTTLLYCQIAIYRLNYIIAGAFAVIAIHQALQRLYHKLRPAAT